MELFELSENILNILDGSSVADLCQDIIEMNLRKVDQRQPWDEFTVDDIFQGIYYMINQNLLSQCIIGTQFEKKKIPQVAAKLGQYMYVLKSQSFPEI
jgi:hypothetical protein